MARMGHEYQAFEQAAGSARYRGIFIVDLTRENFVATVNDAIITEKRKPGSIRQARASSCVSHKTNSRTAFCAVQHFHQRCRNMITVRNQFAENGWFTQCELKQARDTINASSARR